MEPSPPDARHPSGLHGRTQNIMRRLDRSSLWICLLYLGIGLSWIVFSDILLSRWVAIERLIAGYQVAKAFLFLLVTATLLYLLLRRLMRRIARAHDMLARSEADYRQLFDNHPNPMWIYDPQTLAILDANAATVRVFGWSRDDLLGLDVKALSAAPDDPALDNAIARVRTGIGNPQSALYPLRTRGGAIRQMEVHGMDVAFRGSAARLAIGYDHTTEIDARRECEEAMARMQEAQRIARLGSWELNPATGYGFYSAELYRIFGCTPPAQRWHHFRDLLPADEAFASRIEDRIAQATIDDEKPWRTTLPVRTADATKRWVEIQADPFRDGTGKRMLRGTLQDVTEREQVRRQLREHEARFRDLVGTLPGGVMILEEERVRYANSACASLLGYERADLPGLMLAALVAESDLPRVRAWLSACAGTVPETALSPAPRMRRRDGAEFPAGISTGLTRYRGRECRLLIMRDLAEPERMRDALAVSNGELKAMAKRLFSLQEDERRAISRDLHDDIGQTITAMKLSAHAAMQETDSIGQREDLHEITLLADSAIGKLRDLSTLLRPPQLDALGLEAALRSQAAMLFRASGVRLSLDIQALPRRPDAEIEQACFRIAQESLTNALRHAHAKEVSMRLHPDEGRIHLQVADDGDGFDPQAAKGLGMIVMRERAQIAGGRLHIDTAPGAGTCIQLELPYRTAVVDPVVATAGGEPGP